MREFLRLILINVADVLDDELKDERLKGVVAFDATLGTHLGPRSPNSLLLLYNRLAGEWRAGWLAAEWRHERRRRCHGEGGAGTRRRNAHQCKIHRSSSPRRAAGVKLAGGEEIQPKRSSPPINPKTTFLDLLGTRHLDTGFVRRISNIRMRGNAAKLHLALNAAPDFKGADLKTRLVIAPSVRAVEDAFNPAKYGEFSEDPVMEIVLPSAFDHGLAPSGQHVLSAIVQYAPYQRMDARPRRIPEKIMAVLEAMRPASASSSPASNS